MLELRRGEELLDDVFASSVDQERILELRRGDSPPMEQLEDTLASSVV